MQTISHSHKKTFYLETTATAGIRTKYIRHESPAPILHIIKSLGRGGAELLLPESLRKHDQSKYSFHYLYFLPWKDQVAGEIEAAGGKVVCFPAKNNIQILMQVRKIVEYIRYHQIQMIHCHLPWGGIVGRIAGRITGVPVVYTEHNKWERYHRLTYYINKWSFPSQQKVIAVSEEVARSIQAHYHRPKPAVQVVLNGVDTDKFSVVDPVSRNIREELGIPANTIVIGIACVFRAQKRLSVWLEIAARLHEKLPGIRFVIVGDGVLRNEIHQKAQATGMEAFLHFAGAQTDVRPWLRAMDIFMMSSAFEGLPVALLEAMSMGCLPACTDAGGIAEIITDNKQGILVPVADPLQLADRLFVLLQEPARIAAMQKAAREKVVQHFSMQRMVQQLEALYDSLMDHKTK